MGKSGAKAGQGSRSSFVRGVGILTASNIIVKITGLLFKIPMNHIVGDAGMGYYNSAYSVYTMFYMLSTSGLPVALSVMISGKRASGEVRCAKTVFRAALCMFALLGLLSSAAMFFFSEEFAAVIGSPSSSASVVSAAPAIFFICLSSAYKGYFQGCGYMTPIAVSQILESAGKLIFGILGALYASSKGLPIQTVAAYAVLGLSLGSFLSILCLVLTGLKRGDRDLVLPDVGVSYNTCGAGAAAAELIKISLPVTLSASVMTLTNTLDTFLIQRILCLRGLSEESAAAVYGNYTTLAVPMFNLPPVLVYPVAFALVPIVAAEREKHGAVSDLVRARIEKSFSYAVMIGLPCAAGLSVLSGPILNLLYRASSAEAAAPLLTLLAPSSCLVCILAVTNSVLQGCGRESMPVISMLAGAAVKCASGIFLIKAYGIGGAPVSTLFCYITVTAMNMYFVARYTSAVPKPAVLVKPIAATAASAFSAYAVYGILSGRCALDGKISCLIAILAACAVYFIPMKNEILRITDGKLDFGKRKKIKSEE